MCQIAVMIECSTATSALIGSRREVSRGGYRSGHGRHFADQVGDNPERLGSEASFATLCGVSPVERSSGSRQYRRLNRGGDRQANAALHRIVQSRLRVDPRTQDYYERRSKEGKTRGEIVRCLKRYAAREVFHLVRPTQP
ncbi:transposase [Streptomyces griseochromogenes]|uniref:Transposase n=1 Tax=Streptomyces griseochromogenes TaxID=68214 RepID=A0ABS4M8V0_9ACTN|nr:transposase [Streptomyces griseochromogenes]